MLLIAVVSAAGVLACGALPRTGKVPADVPEDLQPVEDTGFSFSASPDLPLPNESEEVPQGQPFTFGGIVYSDTALGSRFDL